MTEVVTDKKRVNFLIFLFMVTYMVSYLTRINYGAVIVDMVSSTGFSKGLLSLAVTGSFVTYGVGQIISGLIGDKIQPKKLILIGFITTVCMNVLMIFYVNPYQMLVVWCINGFDQAMMWPPLVRIMSTYMSEEDYKKDLASLRSLKIKRGNPNEIAKLEKDLKKNQKISANLGLTANKISKDLAYAKTDAYLNNLIRKLEREQGCLEIPRR